MTWKYLLRQDCAGQAADYGRNILADQCDTRAAAKLEVRTRLRRAIAYVRKISRKLRTDKHYMRGLDVCLVSGKTLDAGFSGALAYVTGA